MRRTPRSEPPFDPRWLDLLAERCSELRGGGSRFEDFFIEQRLELSAVATSGELRFEECRLEGAAARWRSPSKLVLHSRAGLSASSFSNLLARHADRVALPAGRTLPTPEMDPPRGWIDWARSVASRLLRPSYGISIDGRPWCVPAAGCPCRLPPLYESNGREITHRRCWRCGDIQGSAVGSAS
jgi:hypothetical protein